MELPLSIFQYLCIEFNIMNKFALLLMAIVFAFTITSCTDEKEQPKKPATLTDGQPKFVKEGDLTFLTELDKPITDIVIEVADDDASRQQGLMNRSFMGNNQGMLFIFDVEEPQAFWMRNTIIPLDIIYVNKNMEIVSIQENAQPLNDRSLPSKGAALYVVEVNAGFCVQYGITAGCKIKFTRL
jgi:uncharacterized protein